ncbi:MAG: hypothetical protein FJX46_16555 [Alphaproteobacteria bacterium]|nr:hypothetical protein [Alphaproteobacteria bacterium]
MAGTIPIRDDFEPQFFCEMGRLVVAAGRLEFVLKLCLKQLLNEGFTDGMLEAEQNRQLSSLCDEVSKEAKRELSPELFDNLSGVIAQIRRLAEQRNDMVHAMWTNTDSREPFRVRPELSGKKDSKFVDWSKTELVPLNDLRQIRLQLEEMWAALQCQRKMWPPAQRTSDF